MFLIRHNTRGFSLIEIMIVAILLAIFAGLAAINISEVFQQNRIKATYGELDSFRDALGFAANDTSGIIPKLAFLNQPRDFIRDAAQPVNVNLATPDFHYMGFDLGASASTIYRRWNGPYLGIARPETSDAGNPTATRKAGMSRMLIYSEVPTTDPRPTARQDVVLWPVDAWNTPYVVYMLRIARENNSPNGQLFIDFITAEDRQADYTVAYVSYGRDRYPGGFSNNLFYPPAEVTRKERQKLFVNAPVGSTYDYEALSSESSFSDIHSFQFDFDNNGVPDRIEGYSEQKFGDSAFIGVIDEGTDDVVIR